MCKYCEFDESISTNHESVTNNDIMLIKDGSELIHVTIFRSVSKKGKSRTAELYLGKSAIHRDGGEYPIKEKVLKIKYCPFCGEKL